MEKYFLSECDGYWYVVQDDMRPEWDAWKNQLCESNPDDNIPPFAHHVRNLSSVTFHIPSYELATLSLD